MLASLAITATAQAAAITTIDLRATASDFKKGKVTTAPVVVVESRSAGDESWFKGHTLKGISFDLGAKNAKFLSFKPVKGFGSKYDDVHISPDGHGLYVSLRSDTEGLRVRVDNTAVMGRTEVKIGTMRVRPGPAIKTSGKKLLFEAVVEADPSGFRSQVTLGTPGSPSSSMSLPYMAKRAIRYYKGDDRPEARCRDAKRIVKWNKRYLKWARSAAERAQRAAKKDPSLKPQAKEAKAVVDKATKVLQKAKKQKQKHCKAAKKKKSKKKK